MGYVVARLLCCAPQGFREAIHNTQRACGIYVAVAPAPPVDADTLANPSETDWGPSRVKRRRDAPVAIDRDVGQPPRLIKLLL